MDNEKIGIDFNAMEAYKLYQSKYKCSLCNKTNTTLVVHHKTYENHGNEVNHLDDLIVLCKLCHEKFHNIDAEVING